MATVQALLLLANYVHTYNLFVDIEVFIVLLDTLDWIIGNYLILYVDFFPGAFTALLLLKSCLMERKTTSIIINASRRPYTTSEWSHVTFVLTENILHSLFRFL